MFSHVSVTGLHKRLTAIISCTHTFCTVHRQTDTDAPVHTHTSESMRPCVLSRPLQLALSVAYSAWLDDHWLLWVTCHLQMHSSAPTDKKPRNNFFCHSYGFKANFTGAKRNGEMMWKWLTQSNKLNSLISKRDQIQHNTT